MAEQTIPTKFKLRHDIASNWTTKNPVLLEGEVGFETDTFNFKVGNGTSNWQDLKYYIPSNYVTTNTEQTITGQKIFDTLVQFMSTLLDENGNVLLGSSGNLIQLGNLDKVLNIISLGRPNINDGTLQRMAYLSDIPDTSNFLTVSDYSFEETGYIRFTNGLMLQWLNAKGEGDITKNWSQPFTSATSYKMATTTLGGSSGATATVSIRNQAYKKTASGFSVYNSNFASGGCDYIAIGY